MTAKTVDARAPVDAETWAPRGSTRDIALALVLAHGLRFVTKVVLAWSLLPLAFGQATLAGLGLLLAAHAAALGLDEAIVVADRLTRGHEVGTRRRLLLAGLVAGGAVALLGLALRFALEDPTVPLLLIGCAPLVLLSNLGTWPRAWLLRAGALRAVARLEVSHVIAASVVTVLLAEAGAGPWSFVGGWAVGHVVHWLVAEAMAQKLPPPTPSTECESIAWRAGAPFCGAALLGAVEERADRAVIAVTLGTGGLGLYELAGQFASYMFQAVAGLSERVLVPRWAALRRLGQRVDARAWLATLLGLTAATTLGIAALGPTLVAYLPADWRGVLEPLTWLTLAGGLRSCGLIALAELRAANRASAVFGLQWLELGLVSAAAATSLWFGLSGAAAAIALARALGAACAWFARRGAPRVAQAKAGGA